MCNDHIVVVSTKDGMNLEFHSNRIFSKFRIRIEYNYSVASNSIRTLNGVEMSCRDATSSSGQVRAGVIDIAVNLFVYFLT